MSGLVEEGEGLTRAQRKQLKKDAKEQKKSTNASHTQSSNYQFIATDPNFTPRVEPDGTPRFTLPQVVAPAFSPDCVRRVVKKRQISALLQRNLAPTDNVLFAPKFDAQIKSTASKRCRRKDRKLRKMQKQFNELTRPYLAICHVLERLSQTEWTAEVLAEGLALVQRAARDGVFLAQHRSAQILIERRRRAISDQQIRSLEDAPLHFNSDNALLLGPQFYSAMSEAEVQVYRRNARKAF